MTVNELRQRISEKELRQWLKFFDWEKNGDKQDIKLDLLSNGFRKVK